MSQYQHFTQNQFIGIYWNICFILSLPIVNSEFMQCCNQCSWELGTNLLFYCPACQKTASKDSWVTALLCTSALQTQALRHSHTHYTHTHYTQWIGEINTIKW